MLLLWREKAQRSITKPCGAEQCSNSACWALHYRCGPRPETCCQFISGAWATCSTREGCHGLGYLGVWADIVTRENNNMRSHQSNPEMDKKWVFRTYCHFVHSILVHLKECQNHPPLVMVCGDGDHQWPFHSSSFPIADTGHEAQRDQDSFNAVQTTLIKAQRVTAECRGCTTKDPKSEVEKDLQLPPKPHRPKWL